MAEQKRTVTPPTIVADATGLKAWAVTIDEDGVPHASPVRLV